jgi:hypothetical protein
VALGGFAEVALVGAAISPVQPLRYPDDIEAGSVDGPVVVPACAAVR